MVDSKVYFDKVANQWDDMQQSFFDTEVREVAYKTAGIVSKKVAADIGAGTGFITEGLLKQDMQVIAIDQSSEMLKLLKEKYGMNTKLSCKQGKGEDLPVEDGSVDYAFANMYLHHIEEPLRAIKEIYRILNNEGKVVITDLDTHPFEFLKTEQHDVWMGFERPQVIAWLKEAGFKNISINCVSCTCNADSETSKQSANVSIFVAYGEK